MYSSNSLSSFLLYAEGALEKRLSESTPPLQHSELDGETVTINPTTTISGVTGETTVSGLSTNSGNTPSRSSMQQDDTNTEISPVSEESQTITISEDTKDIDNDTLWTDGDATRQHKLQMHSKDHVNPTFTSNGFIGTTNTSNLNQMNMTNQKIGLRDPSLVGSSLVDSLIDDISLPGGGMGISGISLPDDGRGGCGSIVQQNVPPQSSPDATPLRGGQQHRFNQHHNEQEQQQQAEDFHQELNPPPPQSTRHDHRQSYDNNSNLIPISKLKIHNTTLHEDETLSTVTDPTESPFIYTYQRRRTAGDDGTSDSVSQITSSIAGSNYSSYQNIPNSFPRQSNRNANNLSWMNTSNGIGTSSAGSSSRMIHRKNKSTRSGVSKKKSSNKGMAIPGPYGSSSNRDVMIRSGSGSGGSGGNNSTGSGTRSTSSYNDIIDNNGVNDEIDYAMNNTNKPTSRRPSAKKRQQQQSQHHRQMSSMSMTDDLSTVESSGNYIDTESTFDVSRLGMGGVSTMHQPSLRSSSGQSVISEGTNESTTQGLGILHYLRLAQHHITRYFFPKPPRIERRKKFDRTDSDDLEELLLEEGQSVKRSGSSTVDNDEESTIDYYGSPGSSPIGSPRGNKRSRHDKDKGSTTRTIGLFILLSAIIAVYRMPSSNNGEASVGRYQDEIEFRVANSDRDPYDNFDNVGRNIQDYNNDQVLDYTDNNNNGGNYEDQQYGNNNAMISAEIDAADTFDTMDKQYLNIQLPAKFDVLANVDDLLFQKGIDIPFYWHVPRSGGGTMNDLLGR